MEKMEARSVCAPPRAPETGRSKALLALVLSLGLLATACGQKRPLQLPERAATPAAAPASAPATPAAAR